MNWSEMFGKENKPDLEAVGAYMDCPRWDELRAFIEETYAVNPLVEYSVCSGAPGWNVKYKKSSKSLCTLYPHKGYFTALIVIGRKEAPEAELILTAATPYVQEVYKTAGALNGARWLMIDVTSDEILKDALDLICTRIHPPMKKNK